MALLHLSPDDGDMLGDRSRAGKAWGHVHERVGDSPRRRVRDEAVQQLPDRAFFRRELRAQQLEVRVDDALLASGGHWAAHAGLCERRSGGVLHRLNQASRCGRGGLLSVNLCAAVFAECHAGAERRAAVFTKTLHHSASLSAAGAVVPGVPLAAFVAGSVDKGVLVTAV